MVVPHARAGTAPAEMRSLSHALVCVFNAIWKKCGKINYERVDFKIL